jgi:RND family efflux transporter MFP subunit
MCVPASRTRPVTALGLLLIAVQLAACGNDATSSAPADKPAVFVETAAVSIEDVIVDIDAVGTLHPNQRVEVRAETAAKVANVLVQDGQEVRAGDQLVQLDTHKLQAEVGVQEATLAASRIRAANARKEHRRARDLFQKGFIPQQEFDDAEAAANEAAAGVAESDASLALARALLDEADIRAPIDGTAGECMVDQGDFLQTGDLLLTIIDTTPIEVEFTVPEEHLAVLHVGRPVSIGVSSYPGEEFTGTLTYIDPEVLPETRSMRLKATFPNDDERLRPGQFASVHTVIALHEQATVLPEEAIVPDGGSTWAYIVEGNRAHRREITLGIRQNGRVEVTDGLDGTETVVVSGQMRLSDGAPVESAPARPTEG